MIRIIVYCFLGIGFGLPAWVYYQVNLLGLMVGSILAGAMWLVAFEADWGRAGSVGFVLGMAANGYATWHFHPPSVLILGTLACLGAWDLTQWQQWLRLAAQDDDIMGLNQRHVQNLLVFLVGAGIVSLILVNFKLRIGFWPGVSLLVLAFLGLVQLVRKLLDANRTRQRW
jgi:hypothetical protein